MSEESVSKLFIDFNKMEESENLNKNGVGLGLSICKNLIENMAGSVKVESKLKQGSKFTINFKTTCIIEAEDPELFVEPNHEEQKQENARDSIKRRNGFSPQKIESDVDDKEIDFSNDSINDSEKAE